MAWFTSDRERRLWLRVLLAMAVIYSTLGLAGTLATGLVERGLLDAAFMACMILMGVAVAARGISDRLKVAVVAGSTAIAMLALTRLAIPMVERTHLIEYGVVGLLVHDAVLERRGRSTPATAVIAILLTGGLGVVDEIIQAFLPNRVFDPRDILFNVLAGLATVGASSTLLGFRQRRSDRS